MVCSTMPMELCYILNNLKIHYANAFANIHSEHIFLLTFYPNHSYIYNVIVIFLKY